MTCILGQARRWLALRCAQSCGPVPPAIQTRMLDESNQGKDIPKFAEPRKLSAVLEIDSKFYGDSHDPRVSVRLHSVSIHPHLIIEVRRAKGEPIPEHFIADPDNGMRVEFFRPGTQARTDADAHMEANVPSFNPELDLCCIILSPEPSVGPRYYRNSNEVSPGRTIVNAIKGRRDTIIIWVSLRNARLFRFRYFQMMVQEARYATRSRVPTNLWLVSRETPMKTNLFDVFEFWTSTLPHAPRWACGTPLRF